MNNYEIIFSNIESAYSKFRSILLENDIIRPCKSITRDIFATIDKFRTYFISSKKRELTDSDILSCLSATDFNDTVNTNIRVMKELGLIEKNKIYYVLSAQFINLAESTKTSKEFFIESLEACASPMDFCMIFNTLICALREGYIFGRIISYPESVDEFKTLVPNVNKRLNYSRDVYDIYGFHGRNKAVDSDSYTPNASYRILTTLKSLDLIDDCGTIDGMKCYELTKKAFSLLVKINANYKIMFSDDFSVEMLSKPISGGYNKIYYGTPGCGKSFFVNSKYNIEDNFVFRTVFHPEYSNADFVGQIIPLVDKKDNSKITYDFHDGIFTQALKCALNHPNKNVILIIEEINRGNASAIFGEIFQLLDRNSDGTSIYSIKNHFLSVSLKQSIDFEIKLPSNLYLIATMNNSDQNVYTLDTAFKRRWELEKIKNTFDDIESYANIASVPENLKYKYNLSNMYIPGSKFTWKKFVTEVNKKISTKGKNFSIVSEDKELGVYFVNEKYLSLTPDNYDEKLLKAFAEKVLMYIWNDIAKVDPSKWFKFSDDESRTLDVLLAKFEKTSSGESLQVFIDGIFDKTV